MRLGDANIGDLVQCQVDRYQAVRRGQVLTVLDKDNACLILPNPASKRGYSYFNPANFKLFLERPHRVGGGVITYSGNSTEYNTTEKKVMLHIAIEIGDVDITAVKDALTSKQYQMFQPMFDTSVSALKERVRMAVEFNPAQRWLILSGNTIAETATPPVRFRSV